MFSQISQQPTVGNSSTHEGRLTTSAKVCGGPCGPGRTSMFQLFPVVKGLTVKGYRRYCEKNSVNVECNKKMVRNNVGRRRTNRWFPEDRGQRENMYKVLC